MMPAPGTTDGSSSLTSLRAGFVSGEWTVFPSRNVLARGGEQVRVEPRVMDVLVALAVRAGAVVSKQELIDRVWPDRHVTDDVLTVTIYALRKALRDEARQPRYVETVSRRGYRWIAAVATLPNEAMPAEAMAAPRGTLEAAALAPAIGSTAIGPAAIGSEALAAAAVGVVGPRQVRFLAWWAGLAAATIALVAATTWSPGGGAARVRHVPTPEAREASAKGRYFLDQRSIRGWQQALDHFRRAVAFDPRDPLARAGLADAYSAMWDFGVASRAELRPHALEEARRALALDADSAEGHAALGRARFLFDWDFAAAERELKHAARLDPDYMPAHQALAWVHSARGRHADAVGAARRALQLDPVNTARYTELAWVLALAGRHDEALREVDRALDVDPRAFEAYLMKGWTCELAGEPDAAFAAYVEGLRMNGAPEDALERLADVYRAEGLPGYYRRLLARRAAGMPMSDTWRAQLLARTGEVDRALDSLQSAYDRREGALAWVNVDPGFAPLRAHARFQQIAARVHAAN